MFRTVDFDVNFHTPLDSVEIVLAVLKHDGKMGGTESGEKYPNRDRATTVWNDIHSDSTCLCMEP